MPSPFPSAILCVLGLATASVASAQALSDAATHAPPQHYIITLPPTPVAEVAEVVLGESLGLPFKVDADVKAEMPFRVDGVYGPEALAREFGYRLWNVDVALIERPSDGLWLIPAAELPAALATGAVVVSPKAAAAGSPEAVNPVVPKAPGGEVAPPGRRLDWLWGLLVGWLAGLASVLGWHRLKRRREAPAPVMLSAPAAPVGADAPEDELTIPSFGNAGAGRAAGGRRTEA